MMEKPSAAKQARAATRSRTKPAVWRIEGQNLTYQEIANLLGIKLSSAKWRMRVLQGASGSITLDRLRAIGT